MKKWIHPIQTKQVKASKHIVGVRFDAAKAFKQFKSKYPKAYEVLGK